MMRPVSALELERTVRLYRRLRSQRRVARALGLSTSTVNYRLKLAGERPAEHSCPTCGVSCRIRLYCSRVCYEVAESIRKSIGGVEHLVTRDRETAREVVASITGRRFRRRRDRRLRPGQFSAEALGSIYYIRWRPREREIG